AHRPAQRRRHEVEHDARTAALRPEVYSLSLEVGRRLDSRIGAGEDDEGLDLEREQRAQILDAAAALAAAAAHRPAVAERSGAGRGVRDVVGPAEAHLHLV